MKYKKYKYDLEDMKYTCLGGIPLIGKFVWYRTPQGHEYWDGVRDRVSEGGSIPEQADKFLQDMEKQWEKENKQ